MNDFVDPRAVMKRWGIEPRKSFSQNFLIDESVVKRIGLALPSDLFPVLLEIGPGLGTLTQHLLPDRKAVWVIEKDPRFIPILKEEVSSLGSLHIIQGDATNLNAYKSKLPDQFGLAGNLPYSITGRILRQLVENHPSITKAVVMIQREVAERLTSLPSSSSYGALTVFVNAYYSVDKICNVKPGAFVPPPNVSSQVVTLSPLRVPRAVVDDTFEKIVRASFHLRRKQLRNALQHAFPKDQVLRILEASKIDGNRRGETLSVEEFDLIAEVQRGLCQG